MTVHVSPHHTFSILLMLATRVLLSSGNWQPGLGPGLNFLANFSSSPQSFTIDVDPAFIELTRLKASLYRPSRDLAGETWDDGAPQANMTNIRDTWINQYVWEDVQSGLNDKYAHFTIMANARGNYTDSVPLHFVHQKSTRTDAIPLLMIHGWPSSFDEWRNVIGPLVNPPNSSLPAFNVVAPDIPGFGFSPAPDHDGLGSREVGQAFDDLMQRLGYSRYAIYTTDLGTFIGLWMLSDSSERVVSHLTDFYFVAPNATDMQRYETNQTTAEENAFIESDQSLKANNSGYLVVQSTRPLSVALAMTDSPVGFVGWMWQLMHTFSDGYPYTAEELITNAMLLYIQGTYGNIRAYKTFFSEGGLDPSAYPSSSKPTGITQWPSVKGNLVPFSNAPLQWIQRTANVTFYDNKHTFGGHFPAIASPQAWLEDAWRFFGNASVSGFERRIE